MKVINQSIKRITEPNPLKCIELAGKVTHKSEGNITEYSHKRFLVNMFKVGHTATLEFGDVYIESNDYANFNEYYDTYKLITSDNPAVYAQIIGNSCKIYTNLRFLFERCTELFLDYIENKLTYCTKFIPEINDPYRRITYHIITNRGISHELVRHRVFSFMQESTRYCNYSNDKFGRELNYIIPVNEMDEYDKNVYDRQLYHIEETYNELTTDGVKAQIARGILPNDLKTEVYMCGFLKDWIGHNTENYFITLWDEDICVKYHAGFDTLRRDKAAHPQAREIAEMIFEDITSEIGNEDFCKIKETYYE